MCLFLLLLCVYYSCEILQVDFSSPLYLEFGCPFMKERILFLRTEYRAHFFFSVHIHTCKLKKFHTQVGPHNYISSLQENFKDKKHGGESWCRHNRETQCNTEANVFFPIHSNIFHWFSNLMPSSIMHKEASVILPRFELEIHWKIAGFPSTWLFSMFLVEAFM